MFLICSFGLNTIYFIRNKTLTCSLTSNTVTDAVSSRDHHSKNFPWPEKHEVLRRPINRRKTFYQWRHNYDVLWSYSEWVKNRTVGLCRFRAGTWNGTIGVLFWRFIMSKRSVTDRLVVKTDGNDNSLTKEHIQPFPFRVGQPFNISIVLLSADHNYSVTLSLPSRRFQQSLCVWDKTLSLDVVNSVSYTHLTLPTMYCV